jgi:hypothetical protein
MGLAKHRETLIEREGVLLLGVDADGDNELTEETRALLDHPEMAVGDGIKAPRVNTRPLCFHAASFRVRSPHPYPKRNGLHIKSTWKPNSPPQLRRGGAKRRGGGDQELDFLEPTAPPPHLSMVHPARNQGGEFGGSDFMCNLRVAEFHAVIPQTTLLISAEYG